MLPMSQPSRLHQRLEHIITFETQQDTISANTWLDECLLQVVPVIKAVSTVGKVPAKVVGCIPNHSDCA